MTGTDPYIRPRRFCFSIAPPYLSTWPFVSAKELAAFDNSEGYRFVRVRLELGWGRMIRHQQQPEITQGGQLSQHRTQYQSIDALQGLDFQVRPAHMAGFIGCFNMKQQEVTRFQR